MAHVIYVAEDDPTIREVVTEYIKAAGCTALAAADGTAAMAAIENDAQRESIDLYILDIMLPGCSGTELLSRIRAYGAAPVILLTALDDEASQLAGFAALADDYVTKPFSPKVLMKRAEALLRRAGAPGKGGEGGGALLRSGAFTIDADAYTAYEDGTALPLTLKEFEILKILMSNPRRVLSRQQLLDLVWGYDYFGDERIVDVHIKNLRKKLTRDPIATVKGVGYRFGWEAHME